MDGLMPQSPPLTGLQKATGIGADPHPYGQLKLGMMPLTPGGVGAVTGAFKGLQKAAPAAERAALDLGPELVPVGGEGAFNALRTQAAPAVQDPLNAIIQRILLRGGR